MDQWSLSPGTRSPKPQPGHRSVTGQKFPGCCRTVTLAQPLDREPSVLAGLDLEIGHGADQVGQAGEAVIADREARHRLGALAELGQRGIAVLVALGSLEGGAEDVKQ